MQILVDEIHVKSDISYKGGRLFASNLEPDNRTKLFNTIKPCIHDVEYCGLFVKIISTDNYLLNVKLFKLFSHN